jgi:hypothetical protein
MLAMSSEGEVSMHGEIGTIRRKSASPLQVSELLTAASRTTARFCVGFDSR